MERFSSSTLDKALKLLDALKAFACFDKKSKRARAFEYKSVQKYHGWVVAGYELGTVESIISRFSNI